MRKRGFVRGARLVHEGEEYAVIELRPIRLSIDESLDHGSSQPSSVAASATDGGLATLSFAEREIVELLMKGMPNAQIAEARRTSSRTVANQLQRLYRKLGVTSRVELVSTLVNRLTAPRDVHRAQSTRARAAIRPRGASGPAHSKK